MKPAETETGLATDEQAFSRRAKACYSRVAEPLSHRQFVSSVCSLICCPLSAFCVRCATAPVRTVCVLFWSLFSHRYQAPLARLAVPTGSLALCTAWPPSPLRHVPTAQSNFSVNTWERTAHALYREVRPSQSPTRRTLLSSAVICHQQVHPLCLAVPSAWRPWACSKFNSFRGLTAARPCKGAQRTLHHTAHKF